MILAYTLSLFFFSASLSQPSYSISDAVYQAYPEAPRRELQVTWEGSRLIINREYDQAYSLLKEFKKNHPNSLIHSLGFMFLYHIHMLENFDFRFLKEFEKAEKNNERILDTYVDADPKNRWRQVMAGASLGLRGMMHARKRHWLKAASLGWEAMGYMKKASENREGLPPIYDVYYGMGMYHYWASWAQQKSIILAFFPDRRTQGIAELKIAAEKPCVSSPISSFMLIYVFSQKGRFREALKPIHSLHEEFPNNLIVKIFWARLLISNRQFDQGIRLLEEVLEKEPTYTYSGFHLGRILYKLQMNPERARNLLETFVEERGVTRPEIYFSQASFYLAEIYASRRNWEKSKKYLKKVEKEFLSSSEKSRYARLKKSL